MAGEVDGDEVRQVIAHPLALPQAGEQRFVGVDGIGVRGSRERVRGHPVVDEEQRRVRTRSWKALRGEYPPAPDLDEALQATIERLALTPAG